MRGGSLIPRRVPGKSDQLLSWLRLNSAEQTRRNCRKFIDELHKQNERPTVLVIGGGARGVGTEALYVPGCHRLIAFDIYASTNTHFVADSHSIPIADSAIDGVWIQAVLEHVVDPNSVVAEIHRVLKPAGIVYAETPFLQHVHEGAYDFTRFTLSGHRYLFRDFEIIDSGVHGGPGTQLNWSIDYLFRALFRCRLAGKIAKAMTLWLTWLDHFSSAKHAVDAASGTYIMARRSDRRISHRQAVDFYSGAF